MIKILDTQTTNDANIFGEILRHYCFTEHYGCYSCFEVIQDFKHLTDKCIVETLQKALEIHETNDDDWYNYNKERKALKCFSNGTIHLAWYWNGDGALAIIENNKCAVNFDCKKDYTWEWVNINGL